MHAGRSIQSPSLLQGMYLWCCEIQRQLRRTRIQHASHKLNLKLWGFFSHSLTNNWAVILFCTVTSHCQHYGLGFVQTSEHQAKKQHVLASCLKGCKGARLVGMVKVTSRAAFILAKWQFLQLILIQEESCTLTSNVLPMPYIAASVVVII